MKITETNIDDIIRNIKRDFVKIGKGQNLSDYFIEWSRDGKKAFKKFYGTFVCSKHGIGCYLAGVLCSEPPMPLPRKGVRFMGMEHRWNNKKNGYKVIKK